MQTVTSPLTRPQYSVSPGICPPTSHPHASRWILAGFPLAGLCGLLLLGVGSVCAGSGRADLDRDYRAQYAELSQQLAGRPDPKVVATAQRSEALILPTDRDPADVVLRRTAALLKHLTPNWKVAALAALEQRNAAVSLTDTAGRHALYLDACRVRRKIAFANPLLDFDRILFVKRQRARANHMCDQFFGFNAVRGGGIFTLSGVFGPSPVLRDVLADSKVDAGRLQGQSLAGGAFLAPDLSFDGKQILFAHSECKPGRWEPQTSWHVFKVNPDGTGLTQLTDGTWNDFDPCWLPNGRIAFISERRGGFGRCHGRPVPTYTLHGMQADGSELATLSFHETNEWQPSVANDGRIIYTRWDYVDRDSDIAHHPWVTTPDGCDARSIHGNFPPPNGRQLRPWMEMDIRAIPGSRKFVATAAPHHGQAYGSFVLLDPNIPDDDGMAQLKRITPDVRFPEAEGGAQAYGTAWPLSEDFHLCVYASSPNKSKNKSKKSQGKPESLPVTANFGTSEIPDLGKQTYGIYLLDSFGNRELLYRDDAIGCRDPIPLRARLAPPVLPAQTQGSLLAGAKPDATPEPGIVTVINVYDSKLPWPKDTRITALRIIQLFPKATPKVDSPRVGIAAQSLCRGVLGTVPVEPDGSAQFICPPGKTIYFQALDEDQLAVQSMRSDTYVHPGQRLTCQGCHNDSQTSTPQPPGTVMALQRPPSIITPDVAGSNPVLFSQLVQPVLERNCVGCHAKEGTEHGRAPSLAGDVIAKNGWTQAYTTLAPLGYWLNGGNGAIRDKAHGGARGIPGETGARASKLYQLLLAGHHDLKLSREDLHRITLWLDCNSNFYGAYTDTGLQAKGQMILPTIE